MNWEVIGATAEWAGAIAVVATLYYLSRQVRESNRWQRAQAVYQTTSDVRDWTRGISSNKEVAEIYNKGRHSYQSLDETERERFDRLVGELLSVFESYLVFDGVGFSNQEPNLRPILANFAREGWLEPYWERNRVFLGHPKLRALVDEAIEQNGSSSDA